MNTKTKIINYVAKWKRRCYIEGIPDEAPPSLEDRGRVPSWKVICRALLRNDKNMELLGYSRPKCEIYDELKKIELRQKGKIKKTNIQSRLY